MGQGLEVINIFPYLNQLCIKFIRILNIRKPTIVDILTLMNLINYRISRVKHDLSICLNNDPMWDDFKQRYSKGKIQLTRSGWLSKQ